MVSNLRCVFSVTQLHITITNKAHWNRHGDSHSVPMRYLKTTEEFEIHLGESIMLGYSLQLICAGSDRA
jgi:hypothetical protein